MKKQTHHWRDIGKYITGFLLPDQPQSVARLLALGFGATACVTAITHPHEYQTSVGMGTLAAACYGLRTTGSNGSTRPWWAKLPSQETVDQAKKVVDAVVNRAQSGVPNPPNPPNAPNLPNPPAVAPVVVPAP